ncbi:TonB-dependent receptor [Phenylobacterium sp.]|uniref:TonB-dependent receptor n=1 Tax=Phenylobacterium sp. TaxID=1871053 RepID=UPI00286BE5EB|nr:TonB-dependent receptor [Phenylobacterium sp.]
MFTKSSCSVLALTVAAFVGAGASAAAEAAPGSSKDSVSEVVVTGEHVRSLEQFTPTGSRLNLSAKETPATLDVINSATITTRGFLFVEDAANSMPGVTSGGTPGDLEDFHIRGFSDTQVTVLHNGIYVGPSDMVNRPQNAFNVESVEILKGPASVLYGQGAIGGAINVVNKAPSFGAASYNIYGAVGSFGTTAVGVGGSMPLSDTLAIRVDVSRTSTDGFVDRTRGDSTDATLSLLWKPTADLDVQFSIDVLGDHPSGYWGTPIVPQAFATAPLKGVISTTTGDTIDSRLRFKNYNVSDAYIKSNQYWPQLFVKWRPIDEITFENYLYYYYAKRRWLDAESYSFDPTTNLIGRDRFFVFHDQKLYGDQASVSLKYPVFGMKNQLVVGVDYSHLDFKRSRGFPDGDSVDPFHPNPGLFGPVAPRVAPTKWDDTAVFFEDILNITDQLKLVTGSRYDYLSLDRKNFNVDGSFNAGSSFSRVYEPVTYRVGLVYDINPYITPYLSYTTGQDPVGSNIFTVNASENFSLGKSRQYEAGVKANAPGNRASMTFAVYDIKRSNVLQAISPDVSVPIGSEGSKGFEATGDVKVSDQFTVNANVAYTDAKYDKFTYVDASNNVIDASGKRIPNSPKWLSNVWASYNQVAGLPLELGGGVRYVGARAGDTANKLTLDAYTTVNVYATYNITPGVAVSFRVDNLFDKAFAQAADVFYPTQVQLGRPRYFQVDISARF